MSANKRKAAETVRQRIFAFAVLLGAMASVLGAGAAPQALAAPSEAKLEVNENCFELDWPCWAPPGYDTSMQPPSVVTIASGGTVMFVDQGKEANLAWTGTAPACESSVPVAPTAGKTGWEGKCTFTTPGTYKFESSTLFKDPSFNYRKYEVVVEATRIPGTPTVTTEEPTGETQTGATLNGDVNPEGNATDYHFEYGTSSVSEKTALLAVWG
jgi:hypothetical protein